MTGAWQYRYQVSTMREQDHGWTPETLAALTWTPWFDLVEFTFLTMHIHKVEFRMRAEPAR